MKIEKQIRKLYKKIKRSYWKKYPCAMTPLLRALNNPNGYQMTKDQFGSELIGEIFYLCKTHNISTQQLSMILMDGKLLRLITKLVNKLQVNRKSWRNLIYHKICFLLDPHHSLHCRIGWLLRSPWLRRWP